MSNWNQKDKEYIWHPYTALAGVPDNIMIESAKGIYLYTPDGRKIMDGISSWWVNLHGHSNEYIADAISQQARKLEHVIFAGFTHEPAITLAERLLTILPGKPKKLFFSDNGSTAVEVALKMAFQYWYIQGIDKRKVIAIDGAFHGDTFGAMSVGGRGGFSEPFNSLLFDTDYIDFPDLENEQKVLDQFRDFANKGDVSAFIYEPLVQGAAGMRIYKPETLNKLLQIAKEHNIICIADEVMTGFGRTGKLFASSHCEIHPDIICMSKGITGGVLPLGATSCSDNIVKAFDSNERAKTFFHGHSFTANPIICAAANASLDLLEGEECAQNIQMIVQNHENFIKECKGMPGIKKIDSCGVILSIELETTSNSGYFNDIRNVLYDQFLKKDILLRPLGNVLYILPPYIITKNELEIIYRSVKEVIVKLQ